MSMLVVVLGLLNIGLAAASLFSRGAPTKALDGPAHDQADAPSVTLFVPCCGAEEGLADNLRALAAQDYPKLAICFVVLFIWILRLTSGGSRS